MAVLQPQLRARGYSVDFGERVWLSQPGRPVYPENAIFRIEPSTSSGGLTDSATALVDGTVATLLADEPVRVRTGKVEVVEPYLEIFDATGHRLVTGIEFLSPANKSTGTGRRMSRTKQ